MDFETVFERVALIVTSIVALVFFGSVAVAAAGWAARTWGVL